METYNTQDEMKKITLYKSQCINQDEIWDVGANEFALYSKKISFYYKIANIFSSFIDVHKHTNICDLGCGSSGLLVNKILQTNGNIENLFCVDYSSEMLNVCADNVIESNKIKYIQTQAEEFSKYLPCELDMVIADCSFWLFETQKTLKEIYSSLKNGGDFVFNFAEWDFDFENHVPHPKYKFVDVELQKRNIEIIKEGGGKKKFSKENIENLLFDNGFSIISIEDVYIETTKEDWLNFYSISSIVKRSMPLLKLDLGMDILKSAINNMNVEQFKPIRWIFYHAKKNSKEIESLKIINKNAEQSTASNKPICRHEG